MHRNSGLHTDTEKIRGAILDLIGRGPDQPRDDQAFDAVVLPLFAYLYERNAPYRLFCERRARTPETVTTWRDIPPIPIAAFKALTLAAGPVEEAIACFMTSGTTDPAKRGRHYHFTLDVYNASATSFFRANVLPDVEQMRLLVLGTPPDLSPNSSLAHYLGLMVKQCGNPGSSFYIGKDGVDFDRLTAELRDAEQVGEGICLLGASFAFVHCLDHCREVGLTFRLPSGSRIMDTGGFKGKSREVPQAELYAAFGDVFGVPADRCVNMYGMTELSMQCYDSPLRRTALGLPTVSFSEAPPWARTVILDPETLAPAPAGAEGIIAHYDLANCSSVPAILTEDLGVEVGRGFRLLGRVRGADSRGCSVSMDELLADGGAARR
jgi:hypothetical protein